MIPKMFFFKTLMMLNLARSWAAEQFEKHKMIDSIADSMSDLVFPEEEPRNNLDLLARYPLVEEETLKFGITKIVKGPHRYPGFVHRVQDESNYQYHIINNDKYLSVEENKGKAELKLEGQRSLHIVSAPYIAIEDVHGDLIFNMANVESVALDINLNHRICIVFDTLPEVPVSIAQIVELPGVRSYVIEIISGPIRNVNVLSFGEPASSFLRPSLIHAQDKLYTAKHGNFELRREEGRHLLDIRGSSVPSIMVIRGNNHCYLHHNHSSSSFSNPYYPPFDSNVSNVRSGDILLLLGEIRRKDTIRFMSETIVSLFANVSSDHDLSTKVAELKTDTNIESFAVRII